MRSPAADIVRRRRKPGRRRKFCSGKNRAPEFRRGPSERRRCCRVPGFRPCRGRFGEFDVELAVSERIAREDVAGFRRLPCSRFQPSISRACRLCRPSGKIFSIEEHDRVGRRTAGRVLRARGSGIDDWRHGTIEIVDLPFDGSLGGTERNEIGEELTGEPLRRMDVASRHMIHKLEGYVAVVCCSPGQEGPGMERPAGVTVIAVYYMIWRRTHSCLEC